MSRSQRMPSSHATSSSQARVPSIVADDASLPSSSLPLDFLEFLDTMGIDLTAMILLLWFVAAFLVFGSINLYLTLARPKSLSDKSVKIDKSDRENNSELNESVESKNYRDLSEVPFSIDKEKGKASWVRDVIQWLYCSSSQSTFIVDELIEAWLATLNAKSRKLTLENGVYIEFQSLLREKSTMPKLTNVNVAEEMNDNIISTMKATCDRFVMQVRVATSYNINTKEAALYELVLERFSSLLKVVCITNESLFVIRLLERPETKVLINGPLSSSETSFSFDLIINAILNVLTSTVVDLNFCRFPNFPRLHTMDVSESVTSNQSGKSIERKLLVKIIKANNLSLDLSQPEGHEIYCTMEIDEPTQVGKTSLVRDNINFPCWDQHFIFNLSEKSNEILFEILDAQPKKSATKNESRDLVVGHGIFSIAELKLSPCQMQTLTLQPALNKTGSGTLEVEFLLMEHKTSVPSTPSPEQSCTAREYAKQSQVNSDYNTSFISHHHQCDFLLTLFSIASSVFNEYHESGDIKPNNLDSIPFMWISDNQHGLVNSSLQSEQNSKNISVGCPISALAVKISKNEESTINMKQVVLLSRQCRANSTISRPNDLSSFRCLSLKGNNWQECKNVLKSPPKLMITSHLNGSESRASPEVEKNLPKGLSKRHSLYSQLSFESIDSRLEVPDHSTLENDQVFNDSEDQIPPPPLITLSTTSSITKAKSDSHLFFGVEDELLEEIYGNQISDANDTIDLPTESTEHTDASPKAMKRNSDLRTSLYARFMSKRHSSTKAISSSTPNSTVNSVKQKFKFRYSSKVPKLVQHFREKQSGESAFTQAHYRHRVSEPAINLVGSSAHYKRNKISSSSVSLGETRQLEPDSNSIKASPGTVTDNSAIFGNKLDIDSTFKKDENGNISALSDADLLQNGSPRESEIVTVAPEARNSRPKESRSLIRNLRKRFSFNKRSKSVERQFKEPSPSYDDRDDERARSVPGSREPSMPKETVNGKKQESYGNLSQASVRTYLHEDSVLIVECVEKGVKKHYVVPNPSARKAKWRRRGVKLHLYNDHLFMARHISSALTCQVCDKKFSRRIGKQAYQCRECGLMCHKPCHVNVPTRCLSSGIAQLNLELVDGEPGEELRFPSVHLPPTPVPEVRVITANDDEYDQ